MTGPEPGAVVRRNPHLTVIPLRSDDPNIANAPRRVEF